MTKNRYLVTAKLDQKIIDSFETNVYVLALAELYSYKEKYSLKYEIEIFDRKESQNEH